jgi:hypothetical protein
VISEVSTVNGTLLLNIPQPRATERQKVTIVATLGATFSESTASIITTTRRIDRMKALIVKGRLIGAGRFVETTHRIRKPGIIKSEKKVQIAVMGWNPISSMSKWAALTERQINTTSRLLILLLDIPLG